MYNPIDYLLKKKRLPAFFIGAGISKRYLVDYPNWDELLSRIASRLGMNPIQFSALVNAEKEKNPKKGVYNPNIASTLKSYMNTSIQTKDDYIKSLFPKSSDISYISNNKDTDLFKYLIACEFQSYNLNLEKKIKKDELVLLSSVLAKSSVIITTNYDDFIENTLLKNTYQVFINQKSYYLPDVQGIGEIYKIHGSSSNPNSIVITAEDYDAFRQTSNLTSAKLLSILCDYPIIFLGYSLDDDNIKEIIYSLINCLDEERLKVFEKNIIIVSREPNQKELNYGIKEFDYNGHKMPLTYIKTDNFCRLFTILNKFNPSMPPASIRKCNKIVKDMIFKSNLGDRCFEVDINELDKLSNSNSVVVSLTERRSYIGLSKSEIFAEVLNRTHKIDPTKFFSEWIKNSSIRANEFLPIFYFANEISNFNLNTIPKLTKFLTHKKSEYFKLISVEKIDEVLNNNSVLDFVNKNLPQYKLFRNLLYNYLLNNISKPKYIEALQAAARNYNLSNSSDFRKCITFIDFDLKTIEAS